MDEGPVHEIVIIKRARHDGEEGHHGGVWKIAFADFMTAMMAFFLVMWLISANDKTRATIARYFNPVQLVDSTPQPRGLSDPKPGAPNVMTAEKPESPGKETKAAAADGSHEAGPEKAAKRDDAALFKDPYAVLADIEAKASVPPVSPAKVPSDGVSGGSGKIGARGGDAYRDPFEPTADTPDRPSTQGIVKADPAQAEATAQAGFAAPPPPAEKKPPEPMVASKPPEPAAAAAATPEPPMAAAPTASATATKPQQDQVAAVLSRINAILKQDQAASPGAAEPKVDVHRTDEGLLIGLTDGADFSMFASASAVPTPKMVALMSKIGKLLKTEKGTVTIRGFTDGRPYRSDAYDNWRLSAARADIAHFMLVRGGLEEQRIDRIEGYADRHMKNTKDPGSAENRRIEILLRDVAP